MQISSNWLSGVLFIKKERGWRVSVSLRRSDGVIGSDGSDLGALRIGDMY
jgi:hypothetical protein